MIKNNKFLLFSNLLIFWFLFSLMRVFLIYSNFFQSYIDQSYSVLSLLITGALQDLIIVLIFGIFLVLVTLFLKQDNSNLLYFKILLSFLFVFQLSLIASTFGDSIYFSLARSHLHLFMISFSQFYSNFFGSAASLINCWHIIFFILIILLFIIINYLIIKRINSEKLPSKKYRVFILMIMILALGFLILWLPKEVIIKNHFIRDIGSNFLVDLFTRPNTGYCESPAVFSEMNNLTIGELEKKYFRVIPLPKNYLYFNDDYPLAKAPIHDLCKLELLDQEDCDKDNDHDGYILKDDCDDSSSSIYPGAKEVLNNGIDENCNGIDDAKPNVILIVLESFGAKYISEETTPYIFNLAKDNLYFNNFYSNGTDTSRSIVSSLCSIFSTTGTPKINTDIVNKHLLCLPNILSEFGYYNIEMQAGDLDFLDKRPFFTKVGFNEVFGKMELGGEDCKNCWGVGDRDLFVKVANQIDNLNNPPFFLTVYGLSVHHPFDLPPDAEVIYPLDNFVDRILNLLHYTDKSVEEFFETNKDKEWFNNSIILITSDNSQPIGERIYNYMNYVSLYEENIWIPLIVIKNPDRNLKGQNEIISSHVDIMPTILDLLGVETMNYFQGKSLMRDDLNYEDSSQYATSAYTGCMTTYRQGDYKLIKKVYRDDNLFFNLAEDRNELNNLLEQESDLVEKFENLVSKTYLYQYYFYKNDRFWSDDLTRFWKQSIELKKQN